MARSGLRSDVPFFVTVLGYVAAVLLLRATVGLPETLRLHPGYWRALGVWIVVYVPLGFVGMLAFRMKRPSESLFDGGTWRNVMLDFFALRRLLPLLAIFLLLPLFMATFVAFKTAIPELIPFSWDPTFVQWDRMLHFGKHPWRLLQPALGFPEVTRALDRLYYLWFPAVWLVFLWQAWHGDAYSERRSQFLLAFALTWILLGSVLATVFSSVGPVYYGHIIDGPDPFAPLLEYLHELDAASPLTAVRVHALLWDSYTNPAVAQVEGISAMPSLHIAMVTLMALIGFAVSRLLGWFFATYLLVILIGSVHLAWHYAIDGYAAIVGTIGIWVLAGAIQDWWDGGGAAKEGS